ncbi:MAG: prepilin-type N-terminal cleavage/methylation domain-containing protein [Sideroxydans sp.]|jgi:general secretion pathway protein J
MHGSRKTSYQYGLTLIELLVAISILGLIAVMGWRGLDIIVRSRSALTADLEQTRGMQLAFAQLQNDCAHLANATTFPDRTTLLASDNKLTMVRTVFSEQQPTRLQVLGYHVANGKLIRRESAATRNLVELDKLWLAAVNDTEATPAVMLQTGVAAMTMRVWMKGSPDWQAAVTMNASPKKTGVPIGLEVSLQLQGEADVLIKNFLLGAV